MTDKNKLIDALQRRIVDLQYRASGCLQSHAKDCIQWNCIEVRNDITLLLEIKGLVEGEPTLRRLLWRRHGCSHPALYGDDGQMDCNSCIIDFKDTPAKDIEGRFQHIGELKLAEHKKQLEEG